ncbi:hypothetical protein [Thiosocius teredinicola]|uniref:hypothetical protein n=1 Tax=Thiosocius teredinicola TaxID=1973002 RepID=UPI000F782ECF
MKFSQVRPGARFEFGGTVYTKTGPLQASAEGSAVNKLIPRSAEVVLLDASGAPVVMKLPDTLTSDSVEKGVATLLESYARSLGRIEPKLSDEQKNRLMDALHEAHQHFVHTLTLES